MQGHLWTPRGHASWHPLRAAHLPGATLLTLNGSQNHKLGPRQFCPPRCFSESCASNRYRKHLQGPNKRQDSPGVLVLGMGPPSSAWWAGGHSWVLQFPAASGTSGLGPTPTVYIRRLLSHTEVRPGFPDQPTLGGRWVRHLLLFLGNNHRPRPLRPSSRWEQATGWDLAVAGKGRLALSSHLSTPLAPEQNRHGPLIYLLLALLASQGLCPRAGPHTAARWGDLSLTKILA